MMTDGHSILWPLGLFLCVFGDDGEIGMVIGSNRREGLEAILEAEASILTI